MKVDTQQNQQIAMEYGIRSIPAVKLFYKGEVAAEFVGALPESQILRWLEEHMPTKSKKLLAEAKSFLSKGDTSRA